MLIQQYGFLSLYLLPFLSNNILSSPHPQDEPVSPLFLNVCEEYCKISKSKVKNCSSVEEALHNYDVLIELGTPKNDVYTDFFTVLATVSYSLVQTSFK